MQFSGDMFVLYTIKNQKKLLTNIKEVLLFPSGEQIYIQSRRRSRGRRRRWPSLYAYIFLFPH